MAEIIVKQVENQEEWEAFIATHPEANFLQSWYWGVYNESLGKTVFRSGFYVSDQLVGVMLAVVETARRARYITVGGGPILDWDNQGLVDCMDKEIRRIGRTSRAVFARVRPQLLNTPANRSLFAQQGFKPAQMHLHAELTSQLDITLPEDQLRNNFRKNTRYELKQAKKRGIKISCTADPEAIDAFYELQLETAKRHGFVPYSKQYLKEQFAVFAAAGKALLYSAYTSDNQLIAQAFVIFYNQEAAYHYGASSVLGRTEPGAYLIQWEAIREAKKRGMTRYNFWGVVGLTHTSHRFYGVSVFKRGYRGEDVEYLHAQDLVFNWYKYFPNLAIEYYRKRIRRL